MTDRHAPQPVSYTVGGGEIAIYDPPAAPQDIPVSIFNAGDVALKVRLGSSSAPYLPLAPQTGLTVNTMMPVLATTDGGTTTAIVVPGVKTFASGVSTSGSGLTVAERNSIALGNTQKGLLVELLQEQRLTNEYLKLIADADLKLSDFPNWRVPVSS